MKLVIFSEDTIEHNGKAFTSGNPLPWLYMHLQERVGRIVLSAPAKAVHSLLECDLGDGLTLSPRPYYGGSVLGFFKNLPQILVPTLRNINANLRQAELIMIRVPSPIGFLVWRRAQKTGKPCVLYIAGDIRKVAAQGERYRGLMRACVAVAAHVFHWLTKRMAKAVLVFTTGSALHDEFENLSGRCVNLIPSVVAEHEIFYRTDTCESEPIRLIYVGRLVPVKGLRYLLEALALLLARGIDAELQLVGDGNHRPSLEEVARELNLVGRLDFSGRVAYGPKLFEMYRQADVFVLPSLSEGVPKSLLEAMASGVPIVATRVGGIPDVVKEGETGLLVGPRSSQALAYAIERLVRDAGLRRRVVENAYRFVRKHTVEKQAERMWQEIKACFPLESE